jgi:hypothetical protein
MGVVGGSVPGVAGDGTSISGPGEGTPGGVGLGWPGCGGCAGSVGVVGSAGVGGSSGVDGGVCGVAGGVAGSGGGGCCMTGSFCRQRAHKTLVSLV